jgi:molybdopterin converting factor small subunit
VKVRVLLFARYREAAGSEVMEVEVAAGSTLGDVWEALGRSVPALAAEAHPLLALDRAYARRDRVLTGAEEIAAFPPVSGG